MIVLINLNKYIGGGETLTIRFTEYLHNNKIDYCLISFGENSYIGENAARNGFNCIFWPNNESSVSYMGKTEKDELLRWATEKFDDFSTIKLFSFCFRDLYNSLYIFSRLNDKQITFATGIYHPEDIYYLSSFSVNKKKIIEFNRNLAKEMNKKNGVLFINKNAELMTLGELSFPNTNYISIPITLSNSLPKRKIDLKNIKIICISRFVSFKIGSIMGIIRFVKENRCYELHLVGYGIFKFIIDYYIKLHSLKNIIMYQKVDPEKLNSIIDNTDIGYAQGTSILEIAKRGLPVIIAPYSRLLDIFTKSYNCAGIFGESGYINYGDYVNNSTTDKFSIKDCIYKIQNNYDYFKEMTLKFVENSSSKIVFKQMYDFIVANKFTNTIPFTPYNGPFMKSILKRFSIIKKIYE